MIKIKTKEECCGCNACGDICPNGAISFTVDEEGFSYPETDVLKCINCRLCEKVCPQINTVLPENKGNINAPTAWAAVTKSLPDRFSSTSGGIYTTLANLILSKGGYIGGAIWGEGFSIHQIVSNNRDDLPALRSSKYAQSNAQGFYNSVKSALQTGKIVLVCGTPCQMAALKLFIGEAENLITVDFICRGVNSPLVMEKYVAHIEQKYGKKVLAIKQKSKELGWRKLTTKFTFSDGSIAYDPLEDSLFMRGYFPPYNVISRPSCYACTHKGINRVTDLTIADCWGVVDRLDPWIFDKDLGTSVVICNTTKGSKVFDEISESIERTSASLGEIIDGSSTICKSIEKLPVDRAGFYKELADNGLKAAYDRISPCIQKDGVLRKMMKYLKGLGWLYLRLMDNIGNYRYFFSVNTIKSILSGKCLNFKGRILMQMERGSTLIVDGWSQLGTSIFNGSKVESRVYMSKRSTLRIGSGARLGYGINIQLFNGSTLEIGNDFFSNINATIIAGGHIKIGNGVICGRDINIRDYNGDHYINAENYKHTKPVEIGDHVWLCSGCTIMPGVKIGSGSVVAANAFVTKDVPPNSLAMGMPAKIVRRDVLWKA